jgi:hypothetical protein
MMARICATRSRARPPARPSTTARSTTWAPRQSVRRWV